MSTNPLCQICKDEIATTEVTITKCRLPDGKKHKIPVCMECYTSARKIECPICGPAKTTQPAKSESKPDPKEASLLKEEIKKPELNIDPEAQKIMTKINNKTECFLCSSDESIMLITSKSCVNKDHQIPSCLICLSKIMNSPCPACGVLHSEAKKDQHLIIFSEDTVIAGVINENSKDINWTIVSSVESVSGLNFLEFAQQGACVGLEYHPYHALYIGGYVSSNFDQATASKYPPNLVSNKCYYMMFSGFDYLTLDAAPDLLEPRFLHQAVCIYDKKLKRNIIYAIGGIQYKNGQKTWLKSCEVLGLNTTNKWEFSQPLNCVRSEFSAGVVNGNSIYVIGGFSGSNKFCNPEFEMCEIGKEWKIIKLEYPMNYKQLVAQTTCCDGKNIWIFGGADGKRVYNKTYMLSMSELKIYEKTPNYYPRASSICAIYNDLIYLTCGFGSQLTTEIYDIKNDIWEMPEISYNMVSEYLEEDNPASHSEHVMSTKMALMAKIQ